MSAVGGVVRADVAFSAGDADDPAATLRDGLESRITFTLRCYRRLTGLAGLFGDRLLTERTVVRVAFYDVLDRRFVVEQDGARASYADEDAFRAAFFTLRGIELAPAAPPRAGEATGTAAARYVAARYSTPWVRGAVPGEDAS